MWACESSSEIRDALAPLTAKYSSTGRALYNSKKALTLPIVVTYEYNDNILYEPQYVINAEMKEKYALTKDNDDKDIYCGNVLTLLYAQRETGTNEKSAKLVVYQSGIYVSDYTEAVLNDLINQLDSDDFWKGFFPERAILTPSAQECLTLYNGYRDAGKSVIEAATLTLTDKYEDKVKDKIQAIAGYKEVMNYVKGYPFLYKYLYNRDGDRGEFDYSDFGKKKNASSSKYDRVNTEDFDLRSWGVSRGAGKPFTVNKYDSTSTNRLLVKISGDAVVPNGDELLYLKAVRLFAMNPTTYDKTHGQPLRNLKVQKLNGEEWGNADPYQQGILELYAELDMTKNILSVWILSTGGKDNMTHERPADWPDTARWRSKGDDKDYKYYVTYVSKGTWDYKYYVTYVSKGTWKLNNLHENFTWD